MKKFSTLVGMDVHARSITCTALVVETGEYRTKRPTSPAAPPSSSRADSESSDTPATSSR